MKRVLKAPAKINICLRVNGKREDGYHDLTMIMQAISLFDVIELEIVNKNNLGKFKLFSKIDFEFLKQFIDEKYDYNQGEQVNLKCNHNFVPADDRNLIVKVVKYMFLKYNIEDKIYIYLKKMIPTGGGLGGGSSDAATMILFINKYYKLKLSIEEMVEIAAKFGSDIPFFIYESECVCEGRGEKITKLKSYNDYNLVIATPNVRVSTKEIFSKVDDNNHDIVKSDETLSYNNLLCAIKMKDLKLLSDNIFNDLERVTVLDVPSIVEFKKIMKDNGALNSMMSGSGPTVFGIFDTYDKAQCCKDALKNIYKDAFVYTCRPIN